MSAEISIIEGGKNEILPVRQQFHWFMSYRSCKSDEGEEYTHLISGSMSVLIIFLTLF
jgi:hypothetical protein